MRAPHCCRRRWPRPRLRCSAPSGAASSTSASRASQPVNRSCVPARVAQAAARRSARGTTSRSLSYFLLRGRCRACKAPFSARYPLVEALAALLAAALWLRFVADDAGRSGRHPAGAVRGLLRVRRRADRAVVHRSGDAQAAEHHHAARDTGPVPGGVRGARRAVAGSADRRRRRIPVLQDRRRLLLLRAQARGPRARRHQAAGADRRGAGVEGAVLRRVRGLDRRGADQHLRSCFARAGNRRPPTRPRPPNRCARPHPLRSVSGGRERCCICSRGPRCSACCSAEAKALLRLRDVAAGVGHAGVLAAAVGRRGVAAAPAAPVTTGSGRPHIARRCWYRGSP